MFWTIVTGLIDNRVKTVSAVSLESMAHKQSKYLLAYRPEGMCLCRGVFPFATAIRTLSSLLPHSLSLSRSLLLGPHHAGMMTIFTQSFRRTGFFALAVNFGPDTCFPSHTAASPSGGCPFVVVVVGKSSVLVQRHIKWFAENFFSPERAEHTLSRLHRRSEHLNEHGGATALLSYQKTVPDPKRK